MNKIVLAIKNGKEFKVIKDWSDQGLLKIRGILTLDGIDRTGVYICSVDSFDLLVTDKKITQETE